MEVILALARHETMDTVVRQACELGVARIHLVISTRSPIPARVARQKAEHWRRVAIAACEQSRRAQFLEILPVRPDGTFAPGVKLPELVQNRLSAIQSQLAGRSVQADLQIPADLPPLVADRPRLEKLFDFLFEEELNNLPEGGRFQLSARTLPANGHDPERIELRLEDNGPGLSPDALRGLFDPFYARSGDPRQSGIRLMACYFIVFHHNGRIRLDSAPEGGLHLNIQLPLQPPATSPRSNEEEFLQRVLFNDRLWEKILAGA